MASTWQNEIVIIVRHLINDLDATPTYSDERLEEAVLVAAQLLTFELDFGKDYTIDVDSATLIPNPVAETRDDAFINLCALKVACIILGSEYKTNITRGIMVQDGPSKIDYRGVVKESKAIWEQSLQRYEHARVQYQAGNSIAGKAVMTPFTYEYEPILRANFS